MTKDDRKIKVTVADVRVTNDNEETVILQGYTDGTVDIGIVKKYPNGDHTYMRVSLNTDQLLALKGAISLSRDLDLDKEK